MVGCDAHATHASRERSCGEEAAAGGEGFPGDSRVLFPKQEREGFSGDSVLVLMQ